MSEARRFLAGWAERLFGHSPIRLAVALVVLGLVLGSGGVESVDLPLAEGERLCLSLRVLAEEVEIARRTGRAPSTEARTLAGLSSIEGFVVDEGGADLILIGRRGERTLHLDDLRLAIRAVTLMDRVGPGGAPWLSLEPIAENILAVEELLSDDDPIRDEEDLSDLVAQLARTLGDQDVLSGNMPSGSRWLAAALDSDVLLKRLHQGLVTVEGLDSALDLAMARIRRSLEDDEAATSSESHHSRLWFEFAMDSLRFVEDDGVVHLSDQPVVVVRTERQRMQRDGTLVDAGGIDVDAEAFASDHSARFEELKQREGFACYADLDARFRLLAVLSAASHRGAWVRAGLVPETLLGDGSLLDGVSVSDSHPALANGRLERLETPGGSSVHLLSPVICGGVTMALKLTNHLMTWCEPNDERLRLLRDAVLEFRPSWEALLWTSPSMT
jgi:hypothetical protein